MKLKLLKKWLKNGINKERVKSKVYNYHALGDYYFNDYIHIEFW